MSRTFELMHDHVCAIYRALTGSELPEREPAAPPPPFAEVAQRFAELEAHARGVAGVADRVPPFSFAPPVDVLATEREVIVEVGVPGVERHDVEAEVRGDLLIVGGARAGERDGDGRTYYHAELPRGPFHRVVPLPARVGGEARIEVSQGIIRIRLQKRMKTAPAKA